jgi:hypothetical protein
MFCTLGSVAKIAPEDVRLISGVLGRDLEEQKQVVEEADKGKFLHGLAYCS